MKYIKQKLNKIIMRWCIIALILTIIILPTNTLKNVKQASAQSSEIKTGENIIKEVQAKEDKLTVEQITENLFKNSKAEKIEYIYNLDDSADYVYVEFEGSGYAIFLRETMELLEYSLQGKPDYLNEQAKYYGGPGVYLSKKDNNFINIRTKEGFYINKEVAETYSKEIREKLLDNSKKIDIQTEIATENIYNLESTNETKNNNGGEEKPKLDTNSLIRVTDGTYIPNYRYFLAAPQHGENSSGTCGAVAAQLFLSYHNYYSDRRIIENKYLNGGVDNIEDNPNFCTDPMSMTSKTLGSRGTKEDGSDDANSYFHYIVDKIPSYASTATVKQGINNILSARNSSLSGNINYTVDYETGGWFGLSAIDSNNIISELDSGRPTIILMQENLGGGDHYVVAYGYKNYTYPNSSDSYLGILHILVGGRII